VNSGGASIRPAPTDAEAVAITAAIEAMWPRPTFTPEQARQREAAWRFSGRWWSKPLPTRRDRPYR
jgi:hypothetical protein